MKKLVQHAAAEEARRKGIRPYSPDGFQQANKPISQKPRRGCDHDRNRHWEKSIQPPEKGTNPLLTPARRLLLHRRRIPTRRDGHTPRGRARVWARGHCRWKRPRDGKPPPPLEDGTGTGTRKGPFKVNGSISNEQAGRLQTEHRCWHGYVPMPECPKVKGRCLFRGQVDTPTGQRNIGKGIGSCLSGRKEHSGQGKGH